MAAPQAMDFVSRIRRFHKTKPKPSPSRGETCAEPQLRGAANDKDERAAEARGTPGVPVAFAALVQLKRELSGAHPALNFSGISELYLQRMCEVFAGVPETETP